MKSNTAVLLAGLAFAVLAGCQKNPESGTPGAMANDPTPGSSPAVSAAPPGGSVATPPATTPAPDSSMAPSTASSGSSGSADTPSQANPTDLKKEQEQATMPHSGQVNNHSVPDTTATNK